MSDLISIVEEGRSILSLLSNLSTDQKNQALEAVAISLEENIEKILSANTLDIENARASKTSEAMIDRLLLNEERIQGLAHSIRSIILLDDPVGVILSGHTFRNGLQQIQKTVPFGLIGAIYESRPNVTVDIAALCLKSGNACLLRGGKEAFHSNRILVNIIKEALSSFGLSKAISFVEDTRRETAEEMMKMTGKIDLLIPRGGAKLIQNVVDNAKVPVIETGTGICHLYVEKSADLEMAVNILINGKTSRPGVCNALESLLVDEEIAGAFLPMAYQALSSRGVEVRGDQKTSSILQDSLVVPITDLDDDTEYLDFIISIRVVKNINEAIQHIADHSTHHSESIVTSSLAASQKFINKVDSAAVYVNASTRFTDGGEFGFGAEIGISTQKLHVRGPVGLKNLVSYKYILTGNGQIR